MTYIVIYELIISVYFFVIHRTLTIKHDFFVITLLFYRCVYVIRPILKAIIQHGFDNSGLILYINVHRCKLIPVVAYPQSFVWLLKKIKSVYSCRYYLRFGREREFVRC